MHRAAWMRAGRAGAAKLRHQGIGAMVLRPDSRTTTEPQQEQTRGNDMLTIQKRRAVKRQLRRIQWYGEQVAVRAQTPA